MRPAGKPGPVPDLIVDLRRLLDELRIGAAIPGALKRDGRGIRSYARMGGLTNRNYKVELGDEVLVLRLPGRGTGRFINRSIERANQEAAVRAGFTPPPVYFNGRTGVKISRFIDGAEALDGKAAREPGVHLEIAAFLARFHGSGLRFVNDFDVFRMARTYERVARARLARFYPDFQAVKRRVFALEHPLDMDAPARVACHNDLVPENFLATEGGLTLIDWEYSGMNDPYWDLASFLLESEMEGDAECSFLARYFGYPVSEAQRIRVEAFKLLQDYLWSLWSLIQASANREPERARSYREYGNFRYDRAIARLGTVEVRLGLSRAGGRA